MNMSPGREWMTAPQACTWAPAGLAGATCICRPWLPKATSTQPSSSTTRCSPGTAGERVLMVRRSRASTDRKSTRLNSSHLVISYAVFCLKKKHKNINYGHQSSDLHDFLDAHIFGPPNE